MSLPRLVKVSNCEDVVMSVFSLPEYLILVFEEHDRWTMVVCYVISEKSPERTNIAAIATTLNEAKHKLRVKISEYDHPAINHLKKGKPR